MKKEIIIGQSQSNSLSTIIQHFSSDQYELRIAPNIEAVIRLENEKPSDFLILSAQLLPEKITPTLSHLTTLSPQSQIILTHTDGLLIKKQLSGLLPNLQMFDSHLENDIPAEMIELFEEKSQRPTLNKLLSAYIPSKTTIAELVPSWLMS